MTRAHLAFVASLALVVIACTETLAPGTRDLTKPQRTRVVQYGITATRTAGMSTAHVVDFIVDKTGAPREKVVDKLRQIRGRINRDPDSRSAERIGVIVANADKDRLNAAIRDGLCKPLADEGDVVALAQCHSRQDENITGQLCRVSNGAQVAYGARVMLTSWEVQNVRDAIQALTPAPLMVVVRDADEATWNAALAGNVPPLRYCD